MFGYLDSHFSLTISEVRSFKVLVISSSWGSDVARLEEVGASSLCFFLSLSDLVFDLSDAKILDSTSMVASCMDNNVVDILSLKRRGEFFIKCISISDLGRGFNRFDFIWDSTIHLVGSLGEIRNRFTILSL
jgi:hypothetical protein